MKDFKILNSDRGGYLSKDNSICLKGILAVCVLVCHLYGTSGLFKGSLFGAIILQSLGELAVSVFFFLSGYGLMYSYKIKKDDYLKKFVRKRIIPFYIIIFYLAIVYTVFHILLNDNITIEMFVKALTFGGGIVSNGWYLQVQLLLYIIFYLICKIFKRTHVQLIIVAFIEVLYCMIMMFFDLPAYWYQSVLTFALGTIWAAYKDKIDGYLVRAGKKSTVLLAGAGIMFIIAFLARYKIDGVVLNKIFSMTVNIFFVVFVMLFIYFVRINFKLTRWLGKISLEIYVVQGIFLTLYHSQFFYFENTYLYIIAVVFSTIAASYFLHPVNRGIYKVFEEK